MASQFLEPGTAATFDTSFWGTFSAGSATAPVTSTTAVGGSPRSLQLQVTSGGSDVSSVNLPAGTTVDAGGRISFYIRFSAVSPGQTSQFFSVFTSGFALNVFEIALTTGNNLAILDKNFAPQATGATVIAPNTDYRISIVYKITSASVNSIKLFINGASEATATNITVVTGSNISAIGLNEPLVAMTANVAHVYADNSTVSADPGDIHVTAKRPISNGTTNGFTTRIGSGGSGVGTGHAPQVNERPQSDTNGWSVVAAGSAITEEYNIESISAGDIDITGATIVDYEGWVRSKALISETGNIIVNGVSSNIALTSTTTYFTKFAGSTTYPAGTGADIGEISATTATTVSLYEAGIIVAYIPAATGQFSSNLTTLGTS